MKRMIDSVAILPLLVSAFASPLIQNSNVDHTGITCHEDIPGNNKIAQLRSCSYAAWAAQQAKNITCYPEFASNVRKNIGGVCMAYKVPTSPCETILYLDVPEGANAASFTMNFTIEDVGNTAELIVESCFRGGKKYLPTPNSNGNDGWMVEVTEGFAAS